MLGSAPLRSSVKPNAKGMVTIKHYGVGLMEIILDLHTEAFYRPAFHVELKFQIIT
jgi:hypothetical protein